MTSVKRHKFATSVSLSAAIFLAVGLFVYRYNAAPTNNAETIHGAIDAETTEKDLKVSRIAASGKVFEIAISPDGKFTAYTTGEPIRSIHLKETATQIDTVIVPPSTAEKSSLNSLVFAPDSQSLLYQYGTPYNEEMFRVPITGGTPVKIADNTNSLSISPDGTLMALHKDLDVDGKDWQGYDLVVSNVNGSNQKILAHTIEGKDDLVEYTVPAWSYDGKWLAFGFRHGKLNEGDVQMYAVNVDDGSRKPMSGQKWKTITGVVWMPDNSLVVAGQESAGTPSQLWRVTESEAKRITNDAAGFAQLSATRDGKTLVTVQARTRNDLWIVQDNDSMRARQITSSGELCQPGGFYPLPDRKLVICSTISGTPQLWILNREATERRQLTTDGDGQNGGPWVTSDGRFIVYTAVRSDGIHVYRMNTDGSDQKPLIPEKGLYLRVSDDSKWVYYIHDFPNRVDLSFEIRKIPLGGGTPTTMAKIRTWGKIDVSPRDERIAAIVGTDEFKPRSINIYTPAGKLISSIPVPATVANTTLRWTPDGRGIAFIDVKYGSGNIWVVPVDAKSPPKQLTNFTAPGVLSFRWSPDAKELLLSRQDSTSDAMMITNITRSE